MGHRATSLFRLWSFDRNRESVRRFQDAQLRRLVAHAYARVPFYRSLFDRHGLRPQDIRGVGDLSAIPITDKNDLQEAGARARLVDGRDESSLFVRWTSGSTGQPMQICCTLWEESLLSCLRARALTPVGWRPWRRMARLKIISTSRRPPAWLSQLRKVGLYRETHIDCLLPPAEILRQVTEADPEVLMGFPTIVSLLAELEEKPPLRRLRTIIIGGETSTPSARRHIAEAFGAPVFSTYGSHEFNQLAVECPRSGLLHVCGSIVLLEILKDGRTALPGEEGEVVATALHSFAMPFIRYRLGDVATQGPEHCPCGGSTSGTIQGVIGRTADYLLLKDGEKAHPFRVIRALGDDFSWIRRYQVVQRSIDEIEIRLVTAHRPDQSELTRVGQRIEKALGYKAKVKLEIADQIQLGPHGKFKICESRLPVSPGR